MTLNAKLFTIALGLFALAATPAPTLAQQAPLDQRAAAVQVVELTRVVASDQNVRLDFLYSLNPDCSSMGFTTVRILKQPQHGTIAVGNGTGFTNFPKDNQRYECNKLRSNGAVIAYDPESGYVGVDSISIEAIYASGSSQKRSYAIEVK
jgi:hypothetical protein